MKRTLVLFVLLALGRMAVAANPVASVAASDHHTRVLPSMDLSYRYLRSCSDSAVIKATVHDRVARYTVVWQNGVVSDSIFVTTPGTYIAVLKNPVGTIVDRDTIIVKPQQDLQPAIEIHRSAVVISDTLMAFPQQPPATIEYFYKWYRDIWEVAAGNVPMLINPAPGNYKVYVRNSAGCSGYSDTVSYIRSTMPMNAALQLASIAADEGVTLGTNKVKAFPNPSTGQVSLQFEKPLQQSVKVNVYNVSGRVMYNRTTTQQLQSLDLSGLPKGYYLIELTGDNEKKVLPLILQ